MNGPKEPYVIVRGEFSAIVELPRKLQWDGQCCADPALDAVLGAIPQAVDVAVWGLGEEPARVLIEVAESDLEIEEDSR